MLRTRAVALLPLLPLLLTAGCIGAPAAESEGEPLGELPDDPTAPAPLPEWVRCWIAPSTETDPAFAQDRLLCQWTKTPDGAAMPIAHVFVQAFAGSRVAETQMLERWPGQPVEVMALSAREYPLRVALQLLVGAGRPIGLEALGELRAATTLPSASAATAEAPWIVRQPFDTWTITLDVQTLIFEGTVFRTDVPLAPFTSPLLGDVAQAAGRTPLGRRGQLMTLTFAAPAGMTSVSGDARLGREETRVPFTIDGPGAWLATPTGVVRTPAPEPPLPDDDAGGDADAGPPSP